MTRVTSRSSLSSRHALLGAVLAATGLLSVSARAEEKSRRTTAEAVKDKGLELVKFIDADVDGDGRKELLGLAKNKRGNLQLVVIGEEPAGAVVTQVLPPAGGKDIARFEAKPLAPPAASNEVILEVYDETPDEKVKRVRVYKDKDGRLVEVFTNVLHRNKNADERAEWERDNDVIQYGDARKGWYFGDLEDDGVSEIFVRRNAQIIRIQGERDVVKLLTGVREQVWRWDDSAFAFKNSGERLNDFLPAHSITKVTASSAFIPADELRELRSQALQDKLMGATKDGTDGAVGGDLEFGLDDLYGPAPSTSKKKGTTNGGKKTAPRKEKPPPEPEIEVDRTAYMARAADQNLNTAWIEDANGDGKGEWVEFELDEEAAIHMVRVVAGCVTDKRDFKNHNVPEAFKIQLDSGSEALVNRRAPKDFDAPVVAFSDNLVKLSDRPWAKTTLIFFDGKREAKRVRLTLDRSVRQGRDNQTCISEVSIH